MADVLFLRGTYSDTHLYRVITEKNVFQWGKIEDLKCLAFFFPHMLLLGVGHTNFWLRNEFNF